MDSFIEDVELFIKSCKVCRKDSLKNFYTGNKDKYCYNSNTGLNRARLNRYLSENRISDINSFKECKND